MSAHFATFILRFRWTVILATLVVAGISSWGLQFISISTEPGLFLAIGLIHLDQVSHWSVAKQVSYLGSDGWLFD